MAERYNLKCPKCGERLWFSQSKKAYYCPNPNCPRSPQYDGSSKAEQVATDAEKEAKSISESKI